MTTIKKKFKRPPPLDGGKKSTDIPLENIPERAGTNGKRFYTDEFKIAAVKRLNESGESAEAVARDLKIPGSSILHKWKRQVDQGLPLNTRGPGSKPTVKPTDSVAVVLKHSLAVAVKARDERLEAAACIVEADGSGREADEIAKKIRAFKRHT